MAQKSSFLLAVLFVANPVMLLFFQNCSVTPVQSAAKTTNLSKQVKASQPKAAVSYNNEKSF